MKKLLDPRLLLGWALGLVPAFLILGFLSNFYPSAVEIVLLALLFQFVMGAFVYYVLGRVQQAVQQRGNFFIAVGLFIILSIFVVTTFMLVRSFPSLFDPAYFLLEIGQIIFFLIGALLALPALGWIMPYAKEKSIRQTRFFQCVDANLPGALLAFFFFPAYLITVSIFNRPAFDVDDIFFDSDGLLWRMRFTTPDYRDYYWRAVHPFVLLIVRPIVTFISLFLKSDKLASAFVLVAFSGALCVFLAWIFVKRTTGNSLYALLIASMLGGTAAHLVFSSLIETYIFLAAVTLIFLVLLLTDRPLVPFVVTGLASFGITITNFIQTAIAFIFVRKDFKAWVKYGVIVAALTIPLTLLNNLFYPNSQPYFFVPSSYSAEAENTFAPSLSRALAVGRVMALHSVVAPDPLILKEEIPFLKVWIFKAAPMRLSGYDTSFDTGMAFFWLLLLLLGGFLFLKNLRKADNRFQFAFIFILLFNFALHLRYGKDVFLYSTNWTYAMILFLALAWKELADQKWFQVVLLIFVALLLVNNSRLIHTMLSTAALHIR